MTDLSHTGSPTTGGPHVDVDVSADPPTVRRARADDLAAVVALLADDVLGQGCETPDDLAPYQAAFARIDADPSELLVVAELGGRVVGTLQLSLLPGLARRGALRVQVEAVRVAGSVRGRGVGECLMRWALATAREQGCALLQLTSDKTRTDAHRFHERLGFTATHEGFKLALER